RRIRGPPADESNCGSDQLLRERPAFVLGLAYQVSPSTVVIRAQAPPLPQLEILGDTGLTNDLPDPTLSRLNDKLRRAQPLPGPGDLHMRERDVPALAGAGGAPSTGQRLGIVQLSPEERHEAGVGSR